jgi:hypothetical protein
MEMRKIIIALSTVLGLSTLTVAPANAQWGYGTGTWGMVPYVGGYGYRGYYPGYGWGGGYGYGGAMAGAAIGAIVGGAIAGAAANPYYGGYYGRGYYYGW